jgi:hypothetical protein
LRRRDFSSQTVEDGFGDDVLDEFVGSGLSEDDTARFAGQVYAARSPTEKAVVFAATVDAVLSAEQKREILSRLLSRSTGSFQESVGAVISFAREIDGCSTLGGKPLREDTTVLMRGCIARLFDICIRSYELERRTSRPCAAVDEVLAIMPSLRT